MADQRITELAPQTGAAVDTLDPLVIVDVSDTSMATTGTDKKITAGEFAIAVQALLDLAVASGVVVLAPADSARNVIQPTGDVTALTLKAAAGQTVVVCEVQGSDSQQDALLTLTADTPVATSEVFLVRKSVAQGGRDIFTIDDSGEVDIKLIDAGADGLTIGTLDDANLGGGILLRVGGHGVNRNRMVEFTDVDSGAELAFGGLFGLQVTVASGTKGFGVDPNGNSGFLDVTAPKADVDLVNSEFGLWLDDTPGSTALHIKAKDSSGTVRTATVPLS